MQLYSYFLFIKIKTALWQIKWDRGDAKGEMWECSVVSCRLFNNFAIYFKKSYMICDGGFLLVRQLGANGMDSALGISYLKASFLLHIWSVVFYMILYPDEFAGDLWALNVWAAVLRARFPSARLKLISTRIYYSLVLQAWPELCLVGSAASLFRVPGSSPTLLLM